MHQTHSESTKAPQETRLHLSTERASGGAGGEDSAGRRAARQRTRRQGSTQQGARCTDVVRHRRAVCRTGRRFGEFSKDFIKLRDYIARQKAYAYVEHFNSSVISATSMFKLSITSRWALMAARGWARLILDRRRDLINDRSSRAAAAEAPLDGSSDPSRPFNKTTKSRSACSATYYASRIAYVCFNASSSSVHGWW